jgi:hypothetical protein
MVKTAYPSKQGAPRVVGVEPRMGYSDWWLVEIDWADECPYPLRSMPEAKLFYVSSSDRLGAYKRGQVIIEEAKQYVREKQDSQDR